MHVKVFSPMSGTSKHVTNGSYYRNVYHTQLWNFISKIFWDPSHFVISVLFCFFFFKLHNTLLKRIQTLESESPSLGLNSKPSYLPVMWLWPTLSISLSLSFLLCKMGVIIINLEGCFEGWLKLQMLKVCGAFWVLMLWMLISFFRSLHTVLEDYWTLE